MRTKNVALPNGRLVIVLTVPKGIDKPYFDKNGVIWLKAGADKRRVNSKEELRRLFQVTGQFHADELPTKAGLDKLDKLRFRDFLRDAYQWDYPESPAELARLLKNMNLATDDDLLNLAGVLMFAERPEWIEPQFIVKAIRYLSNFLLITPDIQKASMPNLATPAGQAAIEPYLKNVALVIVDNIATLCRAGRENDTESWLPVQGWLLDLRRRGISVLVVHHAGKNGDQRGTSAKEDIMDTVITLRRPKDYQAEEGARFEVHLTKARGLPAARPGLSRPSFRTATVV